MTDDQKYDLYMIAGLVLGFFLGFWRGLVQLQQQIDNHITSDLNRFDSLLTGMQPLGQACIFAFLGACLITMLYENNVEKPVAAAVSVAGVNGTPLPPADLQS